MNDVPLVTAVSEGDADEAQPLPGARRGGSLYFVSTIVAMAAALLRYVALARLIGPQQLGLATTIIVTGAFFDLVSDTGSDRFLIQDARGDLTQVQSLVQLVYVARGGMIAVGLVALSIPIAHFYGAPPLARGLAIFALSPLIMGFIHLDNRRFQRSHDFRASAKITIIGEIASVVCTVLAAYLTHAFTAILFGLIARALTMVIASHLLAQRPYAIAYSKQDGARLAAFSRPLILNGVMLFVGSQSDRVLIGRQQGLASLGRYSAVLLLVYYPAAVALNFLHAIYVPLIAAERGDTGRQNRAVDALEARTLILGAAMVAGFAVVSPLAVPILYGGRYREAPFVLALIGILQGWRFMIVSPTTAALSVGKTRTVLIGNLMRLLMFPGAFIGLAFIGGLAGMVGGFAAGEAASVIAVTLIANRDLRRSPFSGVDRLALFALLCVAVGWASRIWAQGSQVERAAGVFPAIVALLLIAVRETKSIKQLFEIFLAFVARLLSRYRYQPDGH